MRRILVLIVAVALLSGCSDEVDNGKVKIRLSNISEVDFENVVVNTSTGNVSYGSLKAQGLSDYKSFELAYRYAFIELSASGNIFTLQPIDYVGESPLDKGNYTYVLDLDIQGQYNSLTMEFIED